MVNIYGDVADFGRIAANIRFIIAVVISIILIIIGIIILTKPVKRTKIVSGIITSSVCTENNTTVNNTQKKNYECTFSVKYTINDQEFTKYNITQTNSVPYNIDQIIDLYYDPNDITNIDIFSDNYHYLGWVAIGIAIFIVVSTGIWSYIVHKSEFAAALGGGAETVGIVNNALKIFGR